MPAPWPANGTPDRSKTVTSQPASRRVSPAVRPPSDPPATTTRGGLWLPLNDPPCTPSAPCPMKGECDREADHCRQACAEARELASLRNEVVRDHGQKSAGRERLSDSSGHRHECTQKCS